MAALVYLCLDQLVNIDEFSTSTSCAHLSSATFPGAFAEMDIEVQQLAAGLHLLSSQLLAFLLRHTIRVMQNYLLVWKTFDQRVCLGDLQAQAVT